MCMQRSPVSSCLLPDPVAVAPKEAVLEPEADPVAAAAAVPVAKK